MNDSRRESIASLKSKLEVMLCQMKGLKAEEENARDNISENLWNGETYQISEAACDNLEWAVESLQDVVAYLKCAME